MYANARKHVDENRQATGAWICLSSDLGKIRRVNSGRAGVIFSDTVTG